MNWVFNLLDANVAYVYWSPKRGCLGAGTGGNFRAVIELRPNVKFCSFGNSIYVFERFDVYCYDFEWFKPFGIYKPYFFVILIYFSSEIGFIFSIFSFKTICYEIFSNFGKIGVGVINDDIVRLDFKLLLFLLPSLFLLLCGTIKFYEYLSL